jgi:ParB family chromosome partitioning protein
MDKKEVFVITDPAKGIELKVKKVKRSQLEIPPFQREVSKSHIEKLSKSISKIGFCTFPIIAESEEGKLFIIDGQHRVMALDGLKGYPAIDYELWAVEVPPEVGSFILEFNTEKPPTVKEKAKQVYDVYKLQLDNNPDANELYDISLFIEEPYLITIGICVKEFGDISVSPFQNLVKKLDSEFFDATVSEAYARRREMAELLYAVNNRMKELFQEIKSRYPRIVPYEVQNKIVAYTLKTHPEYGNPRKVANYSWEEVFGYLLDNMDKGAMQVENELFAKFGRNGGGWNNRPPATGSEFIV